METQQPHTQKKNIISHEPIFPYLSHMHAHAPIMDAEFCDALLRDMHMPFFYHDDDDRATILSHLSASDDPCVLTPDFERRVALREARRIRTANGTVVQLRECTRGDRCIARTIRVACDTSTLDPDAFVAPKMSAFVSESQWCALQKTGRAHGACAGSTDGTDNAPCLLCVERSLFVWATYVRANLGRISMCASLVQQPFRYGSDARETYLDEALMRPIPANDMHVFDGMTHAIMRDQTHMYAWRTDTHGVWYIDRACVYGAVAATPTASLPPSPSPLPPSPSPPSPLTLPSTLPTSTQRLERADSCDSLGGLSGGMSRLLASASAVTDVAASPGRSTLAPQHVPAFTWNALRVRMSASATTPTQTSPTRSLL
jgi:hypothetical protein